MEAFKRGGNKLRDDMNELNCQLEQLRTINEALEEKEREEFTRLKVIKKMQGK